MRGFILGSLSILISAAVFADTAKEVNVVNTPTVNANIVSPDPVPITGTVNIDGTVPFTGTVDTNILNTPNVSVVNFPDSQSIIEPYKQTDNVCDFVNDRIQRCFFDVPAGKVLLIEKVSGFARSGNVIRLSVQGTSVSFVDETFLVPKTARDDNQSFFEASGPIYIKDSDFYTDETGTARDCRIVVWTDGSGPSTGTFGTVNGQLFSISE